MRAFLAAMMMLLLTVPASAQGMQGGGKHHRSENKDAEKKPKVDESGYKSSLSRMPDGKYDPWRTMR